MIKRLSRPENPRLAMVLAHGSYASNESFSVPSGIIIIFVSRTARYLPTTVVTSEFYDVFTNTQRIHNILSNKNARPPVFLQDWERRTYGPGDSCPNIKLQLSDPEWGMGLHQLPMARNQLQTTPGTFMGQTMKLSELVTTLKQTGSGILFVTSCRGTPNLPRTYMNLTANYTFPNWSLEYNLQRQNEISSRMLKRRTGGAGSNGNNEGGAASNGNNGRRVRRVGEAARRNNSNSNSNNNGPNALLRRLGEINANSRAAARSSNRININPYKRMISHIKTNTFGKRGQTYIPVPAARRYTNFFPANMSNENVARWVNSIKRSSNSLLNNINALHRAVNSGSIPVEASWRTSRVLTKRILHRIHNIENRRRRST